MDKDIFFKALIKFLDKVVLSGGTFISIDHENSSIEKPASKEGVRELALIKCLVQKSETNLYKVNEIKFFNRYYYALTHNSNDPDHNRIEKLRADACYPVSFSLENLSVRNFCKDTNFYVAHKIEWDITIIKDMLPEPYETFCLMKSLAPVMKLPYPYYGGLGKWPTLSEAAHYAKIDCSNLNFHEAITDARIVIKVLQNFVKALNSRLKTASVCTSE